MSLLVISGTPGVGKTTLAKKYEKQGYFRLDLHDHYKAISTGYNRSKRCYDIDMKKFETLVKDTLKEHNKVVIDSHIAHLLPVKLVDKCIIITCSNLKKLERRLIKRGYHKAKVRENLDCEIFQVCLMQAREMGHKVQVVEG